MTLTIVTVRPGVQFVPDAADAFVRAETQVRAEFGRNIGVNSTYRSWDRQMEMHLAWTRYVNGKGPRPGHSKAVHPRESFHVAGTALDSNDWRNARIRQTLADNGFIRNRLHVPNEQHHFEYVRARDKNAGRPAAAPIPLPEGKTMADVKQIHWMDGDRVGGRALVIPGTAWALPFTEAGAVYANRSSVQFGTGSSVEYTKSMFDAFLRAAERCAPTSVRIEIVNAEN